MPLRGPFLAPFPFTKIKQASSVSNYVCKNKDFALNFLNKMKINDNFFLNNWGIGAEFSVGAKIGAGVEGNFSIEALALDNKLALYCAMGLSVGTGFDIGGSLNGVGMKIFGCQKPQDYKGWFFTVGVEGAAGVVSGSVAFNIGIKYKILLSLLSKRELKSFSVFYKKAIGYYIKKQYGTKKSIKEIRIKIEQDIKKVDMTYFLQGIFEEYSRYLYKTGNLKYKKYFYYKKIFTKFSSVIGKCHSISAGVGVAIRGGFSLNGGITYFHLIDDSLDVDSWNELASEKIQDLLLNKCDGRSLEKRSSAIKNEKLNKFANNLLSAPLRCALPFLDNTVK